MIADREDVTTTRRRRERRLAFLGEASRVLASSLDYEQTLRSVARLAVPVLGDYCLVDVIREDGGLQRVEVASADPAREPLARLLAQHTPGPNPDNPVERAIATGSTQLEPVITDAAMIATARNAEHLEAMRLVGIRSLLVTPLRARGRTLGAITLVMAESARRYEPADIPFAEELASRAAVAIDNARAHAAEQRARRELEMLAAERAAVLDQLTDGVLVADASGHITFANEAAARLHGSDAPEMEVQGYSQVYQVRRLDGTPFSPDELPLVRAARSGETVRGVRGRIMRPDGAELIAEGSASPITAPDGSRLGAVMVMRDVTADVLREQEKDSLLAARDRALRIAAEAHARLAFLAEASMVLSSSLDYEQTLQTLARLAVPRVADGCLIDIVEENGERRRVAEVEADPARGGLLCTPANAEPSPTAREFYEPAAEAVRNGRAELVPEVTEALLESMACDEEHLAALRECGPRSLMAVPLIARQRTLGAITFTSARPERRFGEDDLAFAEDLARRAALAIDNARLFSAERAARAEAEAALAVRDQFVAIAAHELRTPITSTKGNLQLLARRAARGRITAEGVTELVTTADAQLNRLARLVNGLLDVSRISTGVITVEPRPLDLVAFVERIVGAEQLTASSHPLTLERPAAPIVVPVDADRLEQVLVNLIENARKYSPAGSPILVRVFQRDDLAAVAVTDSGIGIPPEDLPRVFERFRRAGNIDQNVSGMGLGLYIAREIVQAHGGRLEVTSTPGQGSTFTVLLPAGTSAGNGESTLA